MNGYMNANVLGRNRGIKFGMPAIKQIIMQMPSEEDKEKLSAEDYDFKSTALVYEMLYWGLRNNCQNKKEDPDFTREEVIDWVDQNMLKNPDFFAQLSEVFASSIAVDAEPVKEEVATEKKSKIASKGKKGGTN